jgi:hypothetical protein
MIGTLLFLAGCCVGSLSTSRFFYTLGKEGERDDRKKLILHLLSDSRKNPEKIFGKN